MDQYIGKLLDNRYELLECIGVGGMAVVYKAKCHRLNRMVAVKILKPELARDADIRRRFHDESRAVAMLSHTNIVGVYDVSRSEESDYIVMELIDGMTLKQYMHKRGMPLNWREALHFVTQIVRALEHAHSRGIIHRDIKPQNVLVLRDGSVKVTDFGIARVASAAQTTLTQEALGSVHYISPEQARGSHIDGRSDLYSAGVVLYEMLTGRLPFEGDSPVAVAIQHINSIPIPPRDLNPAIPEGLAAITMKAMAPKRENRYASAEEMLAEMEEFRKNPEGAVIAAMANKEQEADEPTRVLPAETIKQEAEKAKPAPAPAPVPEAEEERPRRRREKPVEPVDVFEDEEEPRRGINPFLVAVLAIFVFIGAMIFFAYNFIFRGILSKPVEYTVPDVTFYTIEQLQQDPTRVAPFTVVVENKVYDADYDAGEIISQSPRKDSTVKEGGSMVIYVTVSKGEETVVFDDLTNKFGSTATAELNKLGLVPDVKYEYHDEVESERVIRTIPSAGTRLAKGETVTVVVSLGVEKETVRVINFVGMDIEQARGAAEMSGLTVGETKEYHNDEYPAGKVIFQSLVVDADVERGTMINFQVSLGPKETVPEEPDPDTGGSTGETPAPTDPGTDPVPDDTNTVASSMWISVDLADYEGLVTVKVIVGGNVFHEGQVNVDGMGDTTLPVQATGTGRQLVEIYINGYFRESYYVEFGE